MLHLQESAQASHTPVRWVLSGSPFHTDASEAQKVADTHHWACQGVCLPPRALLPYLPGLWPVRGVIALALSTRQFPDPASRWAGSVAAGARVGIPP